MGHRSSMKRQKGCGLCSPHKFKDAGRAEREPWAVLRKLGTKRRVSRGALPRG
jgi:hypothetical protein